MSTSPATTPAGRERLSVKPKTVAVVMAPPEGRTLKARPEPVVSAPMTTESASTIRKSRNRPSSPHALRHRERPSEVSCSPVVWLRLGAPRHFATEHVGSRALRVKRTRRLALWRRSASGCGLGLARVFTASPGSLQISAGFYRIARIPANQVSQGRPARRLRSFPAPLRPPAPSGRPQAHAGSMKLQLFGMLFSTLLFLNVVVPEEKLPTPPIGPRRPLRCSRSPCCSVG